VFHVESLRRIRKNLLIIRVQHNRPAKPAGSDRTIVRVLRDRRVRGRGYRQVAGGFLQIAIQGGSIKWNDNHLAAMRHVSAILLFWNINDCQSDSHDMAVFNIHAGAFYFVPMVDGSIMVARKIGRRIVGQSPQRPVVDAIG
jgi:hypothetical protein